MNTTAISTDEMTKKWAIAVANLHAPKVVTTQNVRRAQDKLMLTSKTLALKAAVSISCEMKASRHSLFIMRT